MRVLAGDIGGTKTALAIAEIGEKPGDVRLLAEATFPSQNYPGLPAILDEFREKERAASDYRGPAAFGIAGPVQGRRVRVTNLAWTIDADELEARDEIARVALLNDLEANALGLDELAEDDLLTLHEGAPDPAGARALISAGTGLGIAALPPGGRPMPTESGHAGFAPENDEERRLAEFAAQRGGRVTLETVLSGPALPLLYDFVVGDQGQPRHPDLASVDRSDAPAEITRLALTNGCPAAVGAVRLFIRIFGSAAGNAALQYLASGGLFVGGGIAPRLRDRLKADGFVDAFRAKAPMDHVVDRISVKLVLNPSAALLGAARAAASG